MNIKTLLVCSLNLAVCLNLTGCSAISAKTLWPDPVIKTEVEYIKETVNCGIPPQVDAIYLKEYEPTVLPSLSVMGVPIENLPEYLTDKYDQQWMAVSMLDWEDIDTNDIDKKRLTKQWIEVVRFYEKCIEEYKQDG